jgi:hypothetical protein
MMRLYVPGGWSGAPKEDYPRFGFGTANVHVDNWDRRNAAARNVLDCLDGKIDPVNEPWFTASLAIVRTMYRRVEEQRRNDWFTVAGQLGYPSTSFAGRICDGIGVLEDVLLKGLGEAAGKRAVAGINAEPVSDSLAGYLAENIDGAVREREEGWAYMLWSSSERDAVAMGGAGGTVFDVVARLNSENRGKAPYGVLAAWLVEDALEAHHLVRSVFDGAALGDGYFRVDVASAKRRLDRALTARGLAVDSPWHDGAPARVARAA